MSLLRLPRKLGATRSLVAVAMLAGAAFSALPAQAATVTSTNAALQVSLEIPVGATLNTPAAVAGMKWIHDQVFQYKVAPSVQQLGGDPANPQDSMFVAGTGAMFQAGSSAKRFVCARNNTKIPTGALIAACYTLSKAVSPIPR